MRWRHRGWLFASRTTPSILVPPRSMPILRRNARGGAEPRAFRRGVDASRELGTLELAVGAIPQEALIDALRRSRSQVVLSYTASDGRGQVRPGEVRHDQI